jgi:hypothetical protein
MTDTLSPQNAALAPEHYDQAVERLGRVGGFAPGSYISHCVACDRQFLGDKRAINCLPCAVAALVARTDPPKPAPSAEGVERAARIIHFVHGDDLTVEAALHRDNDAHWQHWRDQEPQGSEAAFRAAAAILALPAQSVSQTDTLSDPVAVPAGWRLVPEEPTEAMQKAGAIVTEALGGRITTWATNRWAEMLAAAPPSPGPETGVEISEETGPPAEKLVEMFRMTAPRHSEFEGDVIQTQTSGNGE